MWVLEDMMADERSDLAERLELEALVLRECKVVRGEAENDRPGHVTPNVDVSFSRDDGIVYSVETRYSFMSADGDLVVRIEATFSVYYSYDGPDPSDEEITEYVVPNLMIQVMPFIREFLASMTNRLGVTAFYLPIFRRGRVRFNRERASKSGSNDAAKS